MRRIVTSRDYITILNKEYDDMLFQVLEKQFHTEPLRRNGVGIKGVLNKHKLRIYYDKDLEILSIQARNRHHKRYFHIYKRENGYFYNTEN